jgi:hypothetical protein
VERIEEVHVMTGISSASPSRQQLFAERVAIYGAEQRRLKAAAADRRAAAALHAKTGEPPLAVARRSGEAR